MADKRMAGTYEITQALHIGEYEIVFGIDENSTDSKYMCGYCIQNDLFASYENCVGGNDYVEIVKLFAERVQEQANLLQAIQQNVTIPMETITAEQCYPDDYKQSIDGKVVAIKASSLHPEYQTADRQIVLVKGGFGANANSRGRAVYTVNLYTGKESRWDRADILGEIKELPDWAKERLPIIQAERAEKTTPPKKTQKDKER